FDLPLAEHLRDSEQHDQSSGNAGLRAKRRGGPWSRPGDCPIASRLVFPTQRQIASPSWRHEGKWCGHTVKRVVVEFVGDVNHVQLRREIVVELVLGEQV